MAALQKICVPFNIRAAFHISLIRICYRTKKAAFSVAPGSRERRGKVLTEHPNFPCTGSTQRTTIVPSCLCR
jgi:hypothetical protein